MFTLARPYRASDRPRVRFICAETGFLGNPIDPVFEDRDLFADFLTGYYLDWEPESCFVCEQAGTVMGYAMACRNEDLKQIYDALHAPLWLARGLSRWFLRPYSERTRSYVRWLARRGTRETPPTPRHAAHFHFNILPPARNVASTIKLVDLMLDHLVQHGETTVYAQMVSVGGSRSERMYHRFGFRTMNRQEVTKYRDVQSESVHLVTIVKDLTEARRLVGVRISSKTEPNRLAWDEKVVNPTA